MIPGHSWSYDGVDFDQNYRRNAYICRNCRQWISLDQNGKIYIYGEVIINCKERQEQNRMDEALK